ncbi:MAG: hypothetical protein ACQET2_14265 [Pseudomonadota bacterium]
MSHEPRDPPAYQEYAANMLSDLAFRMMSPAERGLLYTMKLECWKNKLLPADWRTLASILNFPPEIVEDALPAVMAFFQEDAGMLVCPELENYREELMDRRRKLSEGGRNGAKKTNSRKHKGQTDNAGTPTTAASPTATPTGGTQPPHRGGAGPLVQSSTAQNSQTQLTGESEQEDLEQLLYEMDGEITEDDLPF